MKGKLRWKREPRETGLRSIGAAPPGYTYHDGETDYANVYPNGGGWQRKQDGWYWVAFGKVPHKNTCGEKPYETVEEAKAAAAAYVKANLPT